MDPSSPIGDSHAFRANPLPAVDEGGGYDGSMGLDSESRLHHMLNAFAGVGGESSDLPVGKSQMTVAMAFATFEQFKVSSSNSDRGKNFIEFVKSLWMLNSIIKVWRIIYA